MNNYQSLSPSKWECKYHVVFMKYRRKVVYGQLRRYLGEVFRELMRNGRRSWSIAPPTSGPSPSSCPACGRRSIWSARSCAAAT